MTAMSAPDLKKKAPSPWPHVRILDADTSLPESEFYFHPGVVTSGSTTSPEPNDSSRLLRAAHLMWDIYTELVTTPRGSWDTRLTPVMAQYTQSSAPAQTASIVTPERKRLNEDVVEEFEEVPEVVALYTDRFRTENVFTILTSGAEYDDALMEILLDHELALLKRFPTRCLAFHYLPNDVAGSHQLISSSARKIFNRHA